MREVRESPFVRIDLDGSTDRSSEKHLAHIVRYISPMSIMKACLLECVKVHDGRATIICQALRTDGASVMASDLNGVNNLVRNDNPHIVFVHCVCHRLNLCVSQACASIADMVALQAIISTVYSFVVPKICHKLLPPLPASIFVAKNEVLFPTLQKNALVVVQ